MDLASNEKYWTRSEISAYETNIIITGCKRQAAESEIHGARIDHMLQGLGDDVPMITVDEDDAHVDAQRQADDLERTFARHSTTVLQDMSVEIAQMIEMFDRVDAMDFDHEMAVS